METTNTTLDLTQLPSLPYPDDDPSWRDKAVCRGSSTETFYPNKGGSVSGAKLQCYGCSVRTPCADFALKNTLRDGIFGGLSYTDRKDVSAGRRSSDIVLSEVLRCAFHAVYNTYPRSHDEHWYRYSKEVLAVASESTGIPVSEIRENIDNADSYFI